MRSARQPQPSKWHGPAPVDWLLRVSIVRGTRSVLRGAVCLQELPWLNRQYGRPAGSCTNRPTGQTRRVMHRCKLQRCRQGIRGTDCDLAIPVRRDNMGLYHFIRLFRAASQKLCVWDLIKRIYIPAFHAADSDFRRIYIARKWERGFFDF